jgi:hypothetical protein
LGERFVEDASVTIQVDEETALNLTRLAEEEGISLESLLRNVLRSYIAWNLVAAKARLAAIPKSALKVFLEELSNKQLEELAIKTADDFRDIILQTYGGIDLDIILSLTEERARRSGFIFKVFGDDASQRTNVRDDKNDDHGYSSCFKTIFMEHNMGRQWSFFFKIHMETLLNNLGYSYRSEYTDNWWSMQIWPLGNS